MENETLLTEIKRLEDKLHWVQAYTTAFPDGFTARLVAVQLFRDGFGLSKDHPNYQKIADLIDEMEAENEILLRGVS